MEYAKESDESHTHSNERANWFIALLRVWILTILRWQGGRGEVWPQGCDQPMIWIETSRQGTRLSSNPCTAPGDWALHPEDLNQTMVHPTEYQSRPWACLVELKWRKIKSRKQRGNEPGSAVNATLHACSTGRFLLCVCQSCFSNTPAWIRRCFYPLCRFWPFLSLLRWTQGAPCNPLP